MILDQADGHAGWDVGSLDGGEGPPRVGRGEGTQADVGGLRRATWVGSAGRCVSFGFCLESRRPSPALLESHWALAVSAQRDPGCCLLELGAYP